ncbi:MAG: NAD(P)-dependent oxidoreductase [Gemmatimonadales bacterium]
MDKVGFVGLGAIGRPMAVHVARTFETRVWNRTSSRASEFAREHGTVAADLFPDLVAWADVLITCLPTSVEVQEVVEGATDKWHPGQLLLDTTSGDPGGARATADWLAEREVSFVDAPVSGGTSGAKAGTLTVMAGGGKDDIDRARTITTPFASRFIHVGPVGAGHAVKAINQALLAVNIQAAGEGLAALAKLGIAAETALEVINSSSGRSNVTENLIPKRVVTRKWPRTFRLALLDKDVGIALDVLKDAGVSRESFEVVKRALESARTALDADADHVELIKEIEKAADVEIH